MFNFASSIKPVHPIPNAAQPVLRRDGAASLAAGGAGGAGGAAPRPLASTALVTCHYGGRGDLRRDAALRAVKAWNSQISRPDSGLFLELVCPGQEPCFSRADFPEWLQYVRIHGKERNRSLFQKEALWNLGARLTNAGKILFLDNDCMPVGCPDYFAQIFGACAPGKCVHAAWHIIHEGQPEGCHDYYSTFSPAEDVPSDARRFPGMGYCITRRDHHAMDGFNPFAITGSGDAVFIWECLKSIQYPINYAMRYHQALIRPNRPQLEPVALKGVTVQHNFHGPKSDRGYLWSRYAVELFGVPQAYCHIDASGLLAWNDPEFPLSYFAMEKARMHTKQELYTLICEVFKQRLDAIEARGQDKDYHYDPTERNQFS